MRLDVNDCIIVNKNILKFGKGKKDDSLEKKKNQIHVSELFD